MLRQKNDVTPDKMRFERIFNYVKMRHGKSFTHIIYDDIAPVSYTHLTLPTILLV